MFQEDDADITKIMNEMKHPMLSDNGGLPTPLSGIVTPRVDAVEDRGVQPRNKPVYSFTPFKVEDVPLSKPSSRSPSRKNSESDAKSTGAGKNNERSSSSERSEDSSSGSDSESDDKDDANNMQFGLGSILQTNRSPHLSSSERSTKPTPSPRPSPLYSNNPTPSPAAAAATHHDDDDHVSSEDMSSIMSVPAALGPMSPMAESELEEQKQSVKNSRLSVSSSKLSSDEEAVSDKVKDKHRKSSSKRSRKSSNKTSKTGSGSERVKSRKNVNLTEESDSEVESKPQQKVRSLSNSPVKKPHSKKLGSTQSTPRHRPSSVQSTPVRDKLTESLSSPIKSSKNRKSSSKQKSKKSKTYMSDDSDDDDDEVVAPSRTRSPATSSNKKSAILNKMFMLKGGGKGKDKSRGTGVITVKRGDEDRDDSDDDEPVKAKSSPSIRSSQHKASPAAANIVKTERDSRDWTDDNRENQASVANMMKKDGLSEDLVLSDESVNSPVLSRHAPPVSYKSDGRPSLSMSFSLSRIGRSMETLPNKFKQNRSKKPSVKQEQWITSGDERGSSGGNRKRKPSESPAKEKPSSPDHHPGSRPACDKPVQHRKSKERTQFSESEKESRKRSFRESSPGHYESDSKRMRTTPSHQDTFSSDTMNHDNYYSQGKTIN